MASERVKWGACGALAVAILAMASLAHADGMYCGNQLVRPGDSKVAVRARCGVPDVREQRVEQRLWRVGWPAACAAPNDRRSHCGWRPRQLATYTVVVDEWTYDRGPRRLTRRLVFEQGKLVRIESAGYGSSR